MRVALLADTQIDEHADLAGQERTLRFIADEIARRRCDLALHGGDVFERRSTPTERRIIAEHVQAVAETCPYAIVRGNHDQPEDVAWLSRLRGRHEIVAREVPEAFDFGFAQVGFLPWPSTSALRAWLGRPVSGEEADQLAREMLADVLRGLGAAMDRSSCPRILLGHVMPAEGKSSTGQPIIGAELRLGDADLALARAHLYAFGHLHNGPANEWAIDGRPALMPGSTRRRDFGEIETKRLVVFDLAADGTVASREDVPLPVPPMLHIEAAWTGTALEHAFAGDVAGALIRLRFTAPAAEMVAAKGRAAEIEATWRAAGAAVVKVEPIPIATTRARAPEVAAAATVRGKLEAMWSERMDVGSERAARLVAKLDEIEREVAA